MKFFADKWTNRQTGRANTIIMPPQKKVLPLSIWGDKNKFKLMKILNKAYLNMASFITSFTIGRASLLHPMCLVLALSITES